jgi:hypothetical protein
MNTFNSICIAGCIFMTFISMSIGFINLSGAFGVTTPTTISVNGNATQTVENLSQNITGTAGKMDWNSLWLIATGITALGVIGLAFMTGTTNMIGVYLFGTFFWSSWLNVVNIMRLGGFLDFSAGVALITMITVGMTFMFIGAVIGMLSGAQAMR